MRPFPISDPIAPLKSANNICPRANSSFFIDKTPFVNQQKKTFYFKIAFQLTNFLCTIINTNDISH
ncbi:hypothetical protein FM106_31140 [Brachybacterium faecium]|nr:hypothetical protein FM106_31140 [Brachybacterium faecium]